MNNSELAASLRALAEVYGAIEQELPQPSMWIFASSKAEALGLVKAIGGTFRKDMGDETKEYSDITLHSVRIAGVRISLPRNKVCRKTVKWDCEPLLSKEEEAEVEEAIK